MKKQVKLWTVLLMLVLASSLAMAAEKTAIQQTKTSTAMGVEKTAVQQTETSTQLKIGAQDVITASDAGGGYLSTRDILLVVIIILAVIGLAAIL